MNRRLVFAITIGLALTGCAQGRSARSQDGFGTAAGLRAASPVHQAINTGLDQPGRTGPPTPGPSAFPRIGRGGAVGLPVVPSIHTSINAGLPAWDGSVGRAANPAAGATPPDTPEPLAAPITEPAPEPLAAPAPEPLVLPALPASPDLPALPASPAPEPAPPTRTPAADPAPATAPLDPALTPAETSDPAALRSRSRPGVIVGLSVATVDGEHITLAELVAGVEEYKATYVPKGQALSQDDQNALAGSILQQLIDRTLLVQEARRRLITTPEKERMFQDHARKLWAEQEIPKLCRKHDVTNEFELRELFDEQGRSLELMEDTFLKTMLAREFLQMQMQSRMAAPGTPQKLNAYYREHLDEFHLPAQVTWREIVVKVGGSGQRAEARETAESLLDQLRRGADFATLARSSSQGPTASKGGLWKTEPGATVVPAVNDALERLPLRQISPVLEGPRSFHIVRVEDRRAAGPRPFEEVQGEIETRLQEEAFQREIDAYIAGLRRRAIITSPFEGTASAPASLRNDRTRRTSTAAKP